MPYSSDVFDDYVSKLLIKWRFFSYLDIGIGAGKYGKMIKSLNEGANVTGIELVPEYIEKFNLHLFYNVIIQDDVSSIIYGNQNTTYDVVIMGDVIEHLTKSDGVNLIHFLIYRCKKIIITFPEKYIQYEVGAKKSESHRSVWGTEDFRRFNFKHKRIGYMHLFIINGFLNDKRSIIKPNG